MGLDFLANGEIMSGILHAFRAGGAYRSRPADVKKCPFRFNHHSCFPSPADPADLMHDIRVNFTGQGPREIIAHIYGHEHIDQVRDPRGYPELSLLSSLCYWNGAQTPARIHGTPPEEAWSVIALDRKSPSIRVFRYGAGNDFTVPLRNSISCSLV